MLDYAWLSVMIVSNLFPYPPAGGGALSRPPTRQKQSKASRAIKTVNPRALLGPLALTTRVTLKFCCVRAIAAAASAYTFGTQQVLGLNDLYSPIASTHQPYGFDQYSAFYTKYKVLSVRAKLDVQVTPAMNDIGFVAARVSPPSPSINLSASTLDQALERPDTTWSFVRPGATPVSLNFSPKLHELLGITSQQYNADIDNFTALTSASPTLVPVLQFSYASAVGSATAYFIVTAEYDVEFSQRITQAQS